MKKELSINTLQNQIIEGNRLALSQGISLVESTKEEHKILSRQLIGGLLPHTGQAQRIGITGVPGAGKSSYIDSLGSYLVELGNKVAVLAVDPSSSITKGSILGDKTRMEKLSVLENAFIRPSPSKSYFGGIASSTYQSSLLLEAAGFNIILIETVGVGQSETMVADLVDVFVLISVAGGGDELQGIKRGIMELADVIFINKVDDEPKSADINLYTDLERALQLFAYQRGKGKPEIIMGSALHHRNIDLSWKAIKTFYTQLQNSGNLEELRKNQNIKRFNTLLSHTLVERFQKEKAFQEKYEKVLESVKKGNKTAWDAIYELGLNK